MTTEELDQLQEQEDEAWNDYKLSLGVTTSLQSAWRNIANRLAKERYEHRNRIKNERRDDAGAEKATSNSQ